MGSMTGNVTIDPGFDVDVDKIIYKSTNELLEERKSELKEMKKLEGHIRNLKAKLNRLEKDSVRIHARKDVSGDHVIIANDGDATTPMKARKRERDMDMDMQDVSNNSKDHVGKSRHLSERDLKRSRNFFSRAIQGTLKKFVEDNSKAATARREELKRTAETKAMQKKSETQSESVSALIDELKEELEINEEKFLSGQARLAMIDSEMDVVAMESVYNIWLSHRQQLYGGGEARSNAHVNETFERAGHRSEFIITKTQPAIFWIEGKPHPKTEELHYQNVEPTLEAWSREYDAKFAKAVETHKKALNEFKERMHSFEQRAKRKKESSLNGDIVTA